MNESDTVEFKERLTDKFEKEIVGFLNSNKGGSVYVGVNDDGIAVGVEDIDGTALQIKDRIKNNIGPSTLGLFEIVPNAKEGYIQIVVSGGNQRPYYVKKYGMCPEGCYLRVGTSVEKMNEEMILSLFQKRDKRTLRNIPSPSQNLTFSYLKEAYSTKGYEIGDNLLTQLELFDESGRFNKLAYLLSDQFSSPFQYARYKSDDVFDLVESKAYAGQSILKSTSEILGFLQSRNTVFTKITPTGRIDEPRFNPIAMRELVVNAIVHNDYKGEGMPSFEEFPSRIEVSSFGGLPEEFTKEDFFLGYSLPVNPELIRVFRDLGFAERLGTGIRRILKFYPRDIFAFSPSFLRVSVPLHKDESGIKDDTKRDKTVLEAIRENPRATREGLCKTLGKSESTIYREIAELKARGIIRRIGGNKDGYWEVLL